MRSAHIRDLFCRFSDYLLSQVMQSAACNAFHPIEARAARWLLTAQDRAGSRIELTQEALAGLLGAQRTTVNAVARILQDEGLISTRRGVIQVMDRTGLKRRSCECYAAVERHFDGIIGTSGSGGSAPDCG
jgi:CRP-like cAMP-binding protein